MQPQSIKWTRLIHPVGLIRVIASSEIDMIHMILFDDVAKHGCREDSAG